ncbi:MAG TPA: hypothetical protein VFQ44_30855 [Streptosporangiaceae bacterium]|nr:hypothetical protein [Streptosporangiaceae bacterium]
MAEDTPWAKNLSVTCDGEGLVGHAGAVLPRKLAGRCGLTAALSGALTKAGRFPQFGRGIAPRMLRVPRHGAIVLGYRFGQQGPACSPGRLRKGAGLGTEWRVRVRVTHLAGDLSFGSPPCGGEIRQSQAERRSVRSSCRIQGCPGQSKLAIAESSHRPRTLRAGALPGARAVPHAARAAEVG